MKITHILFITLLLISCKNELKEVEVNTDSIIDVATDSMGLNTHNSQNSLDWSGIYKGVTPCADCEGIETEIVLDADMKYILKTKYLGKGDGKVFLEAGHFVWDKTGGIISFEGLKGSPSEYKVGENQLIQLDMEGNVITGALAEKYVLTK